MVSYRINPLVKDAHSEMVRQESQKHLDNSIKLHNEGQQMLQNYTGGGKRKYKKRRRRSLRRSNKIKSKSKSRSRKSKKRSKKSRRRSRRRRR